MAAEITKQLADLKPGEWFQRKTVGFWVVTDDPERREGYTLCVEPFTGEAAQVSNSEQVHPIQCPY